MEDQRMGVYESVHFRGDGSRIMYDFDTGKTYFFNRGLHTLSFSREEMIIFLRQLGRVYHDKEA